jgi:hypothetical protein
MNIAKLQAQLQKVPDQALIGYVQSPNGQVPSYLALAELTRRKDMRSSAAPQQPMPTQTVAAQEVAEAGPGIAALPVPDQMFNPESYASGGIVAFDEGGEVPGFYRGGDLEKYTAEYQAYLNDPSSFDTTSSAAERFFSRSPKTRYDIAKQKELDRLKSLPSPGIFTATTPQERAAYAQRKEYIDRFAAGEFDPKAPVAPVATRPTMEVAPRAEVPTVPAVVPPLASSTVARPQASPTAPVVSGIGRVEYVAPTDYSGEYDEMLRPEISAQEAMNKYQGLMGTDVGRQKLNERLAAMETRAAKEEEQAPWMALAKAGLGMAGGRSQFAVQNIAEGAQAGLKDFADARERLANKEEKRFNIQAQLAQAERAEQVAAATYGLQSEEAVKARNEANRLAKLGYKANLASDKAKGEFEASKTNLSADIEVAKLDEDKRYHNLWYKTNMEKVNRDAVTLEKSIRSNETAQLKALLSESGDRLDKMVAVGVDKTDPLYVKSLEIYNATADALGLKAGVKTTPAATGPRSKPLSAFGK